MVGYWSGCELTTGWGLVKSSAAELQTEGVKLLQGAYSLSVLGLN